MNREFLKNLGLEDESIDKIMAEHGKSIKSGKETLDELKTLKERNQELETTIAALNEEKTANATKYSELEASKTELETQFKTLQTKDLKRTIALQNNIPLDLADRLTGEDEDSLKADAEKLAGFIGRPEPAPLRTTDPVPSDSIDNAYRGLLGAINSEE